VTSRGGGSADDPTERGAGWGGSSASSSSAAARPPLEVVPAGRPPFLRRIHGFPVGARLAGEVILPTADEQGPPDDPSDPDAPGPADPPEAPDGGGAAPPPPPPPPPGDSESQSQKKAGRKRKGLKNLDDWRQLRDTFLYHSSLTDTAAAERAGHPRDMVRTLRFGWAQKLFRQSIVALLVLGTVIRFCVQHQGMKALLAVIVRAWDETPGWYSVYVREGDLVHQSVNQCMLTVIAFAALVELAPRSVAAGEEGRVQHLIILGEMPQPLLAVGRQTGRLLAFALFYLTKLSGLWDFMRNFGHTVSGYARDRAPSNGMVIKHGERSHELGEELSHLCHDQGCRLHDAHHCCGEGLSSISRLLPRIVKGSAAMDSSGVSHRFRTALEEFLDEPDSLVVFVGQQPDGPEKSFRELALLLFWIARGKGRASDKEVAFVRAMLNGNWLRRGVLEHYCPGPHCCVNEADTRYKLKKFLPKFLFGAALPRISQHRWTGYKHIQL
jgi:hypothetical protein